MAAADEGLPRIKAITPHMVTVDSAGDTVNKGTFDKNNDNASKVTYSKSVGNSPQ